MEALKTIGWLIMITSPAWLVLLTVLFVKGYYDYLDRTTTRVYLRPGNKVPCLNKKGGAIEIDVGLCKHCLLYKGYVDQGAKFIRCKYYYRLGGEF